MLFLIVFGMILAVALLSFVLGTLGTAWLAVLCILCLVGMVFSLLKKKLPLPRAAHFLITCLLLLPAALVLILASGRTTGTSYSRQMDRFRTLWEKGDTDEAMEVLEEIGEDYGTDDAILFYQVRDLTERGHFEEAYAALEKMQDQSSLACYVLKEALYLQDDAIDGETLADFYEQLAADWPGWAYGAKQAGIARLALKQYTPARYYLEKAVALDQEDAVTYYYLGAAHYHLGEYEAVKACFEKALELEIPEAYQTDMLWYLQEMEETGNEE